MEKEPLLIKKLLELDNAMYSLSSNENFMKIMRNQIILH